MSKFLSPHFTVDEIKCPCCGSLPPDLFSPDGDELTLYYQMLFDGTEEIRWKWDKPIRISKGGGYRCPRYQFGLVLQGKTNAFISPHCFGALDLDVNTPDEVRKMVDIIRGLDGYHFRIGWEGYLAKGQTFVHIDLGWMITPRWSEHLVRGKEW